MDENKDHKPGIDGAQFKITLNEKWFDPKDISEFQYVVGCDTYKVEEPLNFWHKIKSKLGLRYETKDIGWAYTVLELSEIEGKITVEYKGRE